MELTVYNLSLILSILLFSVGSRLLPRVSARHGLFLRKGVLLISSYWFYVVLGGWGFLVILIASSLMNFTWATVLRRHSKVALLWASIGCNILLLVGFKYLLASTWLWGGWLNPSGVGMPIGISFWTFQAISYLVDVYREEPSDPSLIELCLYMAFWPTVLAGPICRLPNMLPQFRDAPTEAWNDIGIGLTRIIQGLFMKFVLAQALVDGLTSKGGIGAGFDKTTAWGGTDVWILGIGYGFQLFFDFAGYSHIVIGCARLLGIQVNENFNRPYLAITPSLFWTRWHMSLSFWIRDYVFLPLSGFRRSSSWPYCALVLSMIVFGVWHGAKMTFLAWGAYHGVILAAHRVGQLMKRRHEVHPSTSMGHFGSWACTYLLISLGWILFRANDMDQAGAMLWAVITPASYFHRTLPLEQYATVVVFAGAFFLFAGISERFAAWNKQYAAGERLRAFPVQVVLFAELLNTRRAWWLTPISLVILMLAILIAVKQELPSSVAPFLYGVF